MSKKNDENIGFVDFLDHVKTTNQIKGIKGNNRFDGFELYTFLESEIKRLTKLITLLEEKSYILKNYPQETSILIDQETHNSVIKSQLTQHFLEVNSPFMKSCDELFKNLI